jgi:HEAT repeat protein
MNEEFASLVRGFSARSALKRKAAARALGRAGRPDAVAPLSSALADSHPGVRREAAIALGRIGDPDSVPPLLGALADREAAVREGALAALIRLRDRRAVPSAIPLLKDPEIRIRIGVIRLLGVLGGGAARDAIRGMLSDLSSEVREEAERALARPVRGRLRPGHHTVFTHATKDPVYSGEGGHDRRVDEI